MPSTHRQATAALHRSTGIVGCILATEAPKLLLDIDTGLLGRLRGRFLTEGPPPQQHAGLPVWSPRSIIGSSRHR